MAMVGSIGVFMVAEDASSQADRLGIKVHVVRAGAFKGAGVPGTEITGEQLAEWQRNINVFYGHFVEAVATGRGLAADKVRDELADGRVYVGADALALKLVDGVQSFDDTLAQLQARVTPPPSTPPNKSTTRPPQRSAPKMSTENQPVAATHREIKAACPGATSDFILAQLDQQATLAEAQGAWMSEQQKQLAAKEQELAEARKKKEPAPKRPGVAALGTGKAGKPKKKNEECDDEEDDADAGYEGDPVADYSAAVAKRMTGGMSRAKAAIAVARANPELHRAFLDATNSPQVSGLIAARFES
jgi:hypothetical protein